jgi:outer membrane lipoprotein SlyB
MAKTVIGVLQSAEQARQAVDELLKSGFEQQAVGVISADFAREAQAAIQGGSTGTAIGALAGLLLGAVTLAVPGIGPVLAAGHAVALIGTTTLGALAGGIVGALVKKGIPEEQANFFAEGLRRGGALVTVLAKTDQDASRAVEILKRHGAEKIDERIVQWRGLGWRGPLAAMSRKTSKKAQKEKPATAQGATGVEPGVPFAAVEIYAMEIEIPEDAYAGPERRMNQGAYSGEDRRQAA